MQVRSAVTGFVRCVVVASFVWMNVAASYASQLEDITGEARVVEGDLIHIDGRALRLWGVDAPEPQQNCYRANGIWPCGQAAIDHLRTFVGSKPVSCSLIERGDDDIILAKCTMMGLDLSAEMANHGLALVRRDGPQDYILNHLDGRTHTAGIWSSIYVTPWEWREGRRVVEWITDERGCSVKGDIADDGALLYYLPNQTAFQTVRIDVSAGERWFCSSDEAEAAGWQAYGE
jgi:endonuclease YncB( thermonuclease family)